MKREFICKTNLFGHWILSYYYIILRVGVERLGPDCSVVPKTGQGSKGTNWSTGISIEFQENFFFTLRMTEHWDRLTREVVKSSPLETLKTCYRCNPVQPVLGEPALVGGLDYRVSLQWVCNIDLEQNAAVFYSRSPENMIDFSYSHTFDGSVTSVLPGVLSSTQMCSCWESATPARPTGLLVWLPQTDPCSALLCVPKGFLPSLDFLLSRTLCLIYASKMNVLLD